MGSWPSYIRIQSNSIIMEYFGDTFFLKNSIIIDFAKKKMKLPGVSNFGKKICLEIPKKTKIRHENVDSIIKNVHRANLEALFRKNSIIINCTCIITEFDCISLIA